jgi:hypothetical protein
LSNDDLLQPTLSGHTGGDDSYRDLERYLKANKLL